MLLFFLFLLIVLLIILLIILCSELKIEIKKFEFKNIENKFITIYDFKIGLYFFGKIKLFSIKINNDNISKILKKEYLKNKYKKRKELTKEQNSILRKTIIELIKNVNTKNLDLQIYVDTPSVSLTSYVVAIISTILSINISNIFHNFYNKNNNFKIIPLYKNEFYICITLNCIIELKVVHIISMLKKIGGIKNERSSNRRFNINCHGKHKKYGRC